MARKVVHTNICNRCASRPPAADSPIVVIVFAIFQTVESLNAILYTLVGIIPYLTTVTQIVG